MGTGIIVCGLNGAGKSTLGKALAKELNFYFINNEELYFPKTDPHYVYASPRTRGEVEQMLFSGTIIRIDGTISIEENISLIIEKIHGVDKYTEMELVIS